MWITNEFYQGQAETWHYVLQTEDDNAIVMVRDKKLLVAVKPGCTYNHDNQSGQTHTVSDTDFDGKYLQMQIEGEVLEPAKVGIGKEYYVEHFEDIDIHNPHDITRYVMIDTDPQFKNR